MFQGDISKVAGSSLCKSLSPGNQVDGLLGVVNTNARELRWQYFKRASSEMGSAGIDDRVR